MTLLEQCIVGSPPGIMEEGTLPDSKHTGSPGQDNDEPGVSDAINNIIEGL